MRLTLHYRILLKNTQKIIKNTQKKFVSTGDEKEERENPLYGACFDARQDEYATVNKANKGLLF